MDVRCLSEPHVNNSFLLKWRNLTHSYTSGKEAFFATKQHQVALQSCCGQVESGSMTAILGPSGAGKSTLLNCITGKITLNADGKCFIRVPRHLESDLKSSRIAYVPQSTQFLSLFTVKETLVFASRINDSNFQVKVHMSEIESVLGTLDMGNTIDWPLTKLSGGQMKRIAIACALVTKPAVIVLDEPTSGLDADNAERLIYHLKTLATNASIGLKPAILLTIHSPSIKMFASFDQIYILAVGGHNIYQGPPDTMIQYFRSFGFHRRRGDPAEWAVEIAGGKYGAAHFTSMVRASAYESAIVDVKETRDIDISSINRCRTSGLHQTRLLTSRLLEYYFIKSPQAFLKVLMFFGISTMYFWFFKDNNIGDPMCELQMGNYNASLNLETGFTTFKIKGNLKSQFANMNRTAVFGMLTITCMNFLSLLSAILLIMLHKSVYRREVGNLWYTKTSLFFARFFADSVVRAACVCGFSLAVFHFVQMPFEFWRFALFAVPFFILMSIWENIASAIALLMGDRSSLLEIIGIIVGLACVDTILLDFISSKRIVNALILRIKSIMPMNNTYSCMMVALYGEKRCKSSFERAIESLSIQGLSSPRGLIAKLWLFLSITKRRLVNQLDFLDVDEDTTSSLYDSLTRWVEKEKHSAPQESSGVLEFYEIHDNEIYHQTLVLLLWLTLSSFTLWCTMKRTINLYTSD